MAYAGWPRKFESAVQSAEFSLKNAGKLTERKGIQLQPQVGVQRKVKAVSIPVGWCLSYIGTGAHIGYVGRAILLFWLYWQLWKVHCATRFQRTACLLLQLSQNDAVPQVRCIRGSNPCQMTLDLFCIIVEVVQVNIRQHACQATYFTLDDEHIGD